MDIKTLGNEISKIIHRCIREDCQGCVAEAQLITPLIKSYMASVIGEFEIETDEAAYQRNNLKYEQRIRAGLSQPATRHGEEGDSV